MSASGEIRERVAAYFDRKPLAMTLMAAQQLGLPEAQVLRALVGRGATELDPGVLEDILQDLSGWGRCHVIVSNRGATLEAYGEFGNLSRTGPFLNVQTPTLDMHLRPEAIRAVFCLDKRGHQDGQPIHTVQCYDAEGASVFKVVMLRFGEAKQYSPDQEAAYASLQTRFGLK
jgi:putative heme iron utilization protein